MRGTLTGIAIGTLLLCSTCTDKGYMPIEYELTLQAWNEKGLPKVDTEDCLHHAKIIQTHSDKQFKELCGVGPEVAAACTIFDNGNGFAAVIAPNINIDNRGEPVVHEALHSFVFCSSLSKPDDVFDYDHSDRRVWFHGDNPQSVQSRAQELVMSHNDGGD